MKAAQVLDLQADLMVRSLSRDWGRAMELHLEADYGPGQEGTAYASHIVGTLHDTVRDAAAYYVAPEMTELVQWASNGLDGTDCVRMDEVPTSNGFAYFPEPLTLNDVRGQILKINAIVWAKTVVRWRGDRGQASLPETAFVVSYFNDRQRTPDAVALQMMDMDDLGAGRWGLIGSQLVSEGMRLGPALIPPDSDRLHRNPLDEDMGDAVPVPFGNVVRLIHAYWLMLNQTVTHLSEAEVPRAFAKRARRMEIPDRVTIVALRRVEGASHGEHDVEWQHRWMVRGHWRWQHVSEHHPLAEPAPDGGWRARVWVRPHIKGPEDKPFVLTNKVYALVR